MESGLWTRGMLTVVHHGIFLVDGIRNCREMDHSISSLESVDRVLITAGHIGCPHLSVWCPIILAWSPVDLDSAVPVVRTKLDDMTADCASCSGDGDTHGGL